MIEIDEKNVKQGVLGLVIVLVEIIRDALRLQAIRRIEGNSLTESEVDRLGRALMDLDVAIEQIKDELAVSETVQTIREGLDDVVDDALDQLLNPTRWEN